MGDIVVAPITETVAVKDTETNVVTLGSATNSVTNSEIYNVVVEVENTTTVIAGSPGPAGPPGISEDSVAYARQTDFVGEDIIYKGEAEAGSPLTSPLWRIRKITISPDGDVAEIWADGNTNFDNVWSDRYTLSYS